VSRRVGASTVFFFFFFFFFLSFLPHSGGAPHTSARNGWRGNVQCAVAAAQGGIREVTTTEVQAEQWRHWAAKQDRYSCVLSNLDGERCVGEPTIPPITCQALLLESCNCAHLSLMQLGECGEFMTDCDGTMMIAMINSELPAPNWLLLALLIGRKPAAMCLVLAAAHR